MRECDSEARPRNRFWGVGMRSPLGCGRAIFFGMWSAIAFGMWEGDSASADRRYRFLGCGRAIAKRDLGIVFGMYVECDRFWGMWGMR